MTLFFPNQKPEEGPAEKSLGILLSVGQFAPMAGVRTEKLIQRRLGEIPPVRKGVETNTLLTGIYPNWRSLPWSGESVAIFGTYPGSSIDYSVEVMEFRALAAYRGNYPTSGSYSCAPAGLWKEMKKQKIERIINYPASEGNRSGLIQVHFPSTRSFGNNLIRPRKWVKLIILRLQIKLGKIIFKGCAVGTCSDDPNSHLAEPTSELQVELTYARIGTLLGWRAGELASKSYLRLAVSRVSINLSNFWSNVAKCMN